MIPGYFENGTNTIVVQGFNLSLTSSDFVDVELVGILKDALPPSLGLFAEAGQLDQLNRVMLQFASRCAASTGVSCG